MKKFKSFLVLVLIAFSIVLLVSCEGHVCSFTDYVVIKNATCIENGVEEATCSCGNKNQKTIPATGHKWSSEFKYDADSHYYACENDGCTEKKEIAPHQFDEVTITKEPTCTEEGQRAEKCSSCGYTKYTVLEKTTEHPYETEWQSNETHHWHKVTCIHDDEIVKYGEHIWTKWETVTEATYTTEGLEKHSCSICGYTETRKIDIISHEHNYVNYVSNKDATCTQDGTKTGKCDKCDATNTITDIGSKLGHSFTNYVSNNDATCTQDGTKTAKCDRCDATNTITDVGSKLPHTYNQEVATQAYLAHEATCTEAALYYYSCTCGAKGTETFSYGNPLGHSYSTEWSKDATYHWHSSACGHDVVSDKTTHTYGDWVITKEATLFETGIEERTCSICNHKETRIIDMLEGYDACFYDGTVLLDTQRVRAGNQPEYFEPYKYGYIFTGWKDSNGYNLTVLPNINVNTNFYASFAKSYFVTFVDGDGTELKVIEVAEGTRFADITDKPTPAWNSDIYEFSNWDTDFISLDSDITVTAIYNLRKYHVTFKDVNGNIIDNTQDIEYGFAAVKPIISDYYYTENNGIGIAKSFTEWVLEDSYNNDSTVDSIHKDSVFVPLYNSPYDKPLFVINKLNNGSTSKVTIALWLPSNMALKGINFKIRYNGYNLSGNIMNPVPSWLSNLDNSIYDYNTNNNASIFSFVWTASETLNQSYSLFINDMYFTTDAGNINLDNLVVEDLYYIVIKDGKQETVVPEIVKR